MSDPADINNRLEAAAVKAEGASEILRRMANDPTGAYIPTESGLLPSLAEWIGIRDQVVEAASLANGRWCGASATAPATRLDGAALQAGDEYQNTTGDKLRYSWSGSAWVALNSSAQTLEGQLAGPNGADKMPSSVAHMTGSADIRARTNLNRSIMVEAPAGNSKAFAQFFRTGVVDVSKAGQSIPPFVYDTAGNQYTERRPISHQHIPQLILDNTPKILLESPSTPGEHLVVVRKREVGYLVVQLRNNLTTTNNSLATGNTDPTMRRISGVLSAVAAVVGQFDTATLVGSWITASLGAVSPEVPAYTGGATYNYRRTTDANATFTFTVRPHKGFISLAFLASNVGNAAATVTVDGTAYTVNLNNASNVIRYFRFPAWKDTVTVEIKNTGAGSTLNYLGRDFCTLDKWDGSPANTCGYYRNSAEADYLTNNSENDYVLREYTSNFYGGGYHGGESSIVDTYRVDGVTQVPGATPVVGNKITLQSSCSIDWTPAGTAVVAAIRKRLDFCQGGYYSAVGITGNMECSELYSALFGANEAFTLVDAPVRADLATDITNNQRLLVGRTTQVILRNPTTGQAIIVDYTVHQDDLASQYGGVFIWRVDGSYKKIYYARAHTGRLAINGGYSRNKYEFI